MLEWLLMLVGVGHAETADEIIARARAANQVSSSIQAVRMTIMQGSAQRVRDLELKSRRESDGTVKSYMRISSPSDVAGITLLLIDHPGTTNDEQYLYLPVTKRANRLPAEQRKGSFVGSDFSYEDLDFRSAAEGSRSITAETSTEWEITTVTGEGSSYSKVVVHMGKADLIAHKVDFYDKKTGVLVKELVVKRIEKDGTRNVPVESEMRSLTKNTKTTIQILSHQYDVGRDVLPDETFTPQYLER